jgi:hypothetical protein
MMLACGMLTKTSGPEVDEHHVAPQPDATERLRVESGGRPVE